MEYNEVFSVSRSTLFGCESTGNKKDGDSKPNAMLWSGSSPVDSLRMAAVSGGKKKDRQQKSHHPTGNGSDGRVTTGDSKSVDGYVLFTPQRSVDEAPDVGSPTEAPAVLLVTNVETSSLGNCQPRDVNGQGVELELVEDKASLDNNDDDNEATKVSEGRARRWLRLCHCSRELFAVKLFYFAFIGSLGVVFTYSSIFLKQHGLSAFEIGIISGIRPIIGFLSAPAWGALADRYGIRRFLMIGSLLAWLAFFVGLYMVPEPARRSQCPDSLEPFLQRMKLHRIARRSADANSTDVAEYPYDSSTATSSGILEHSSMSATGSNLDGGPSSWNGSLTGNDSMLGDNEQNLLREDLEWLYDPDSRYQVFIICLMIICSGELFQAPTTAMSDAATLQILGRDRIDQYGAQRAWGPIGWAINALFTGCILNAIKWNEVNCGILLSFTNYRVVSFIFIPSFVLGFAAAFKISFATKEGSGEKNDQGNRESNKAGTSSSSSQHSVVGVLKVFLNVRNGSWIVTTLFVGICNGVIWGFLFWHLDNLGGSKLLMGIDSVVVCIFEFGAFLIVDYVIKIVGHMGVMYIGLLGYVIRFTVYAVITNPWLVLPVEILQGVTFSFIWVSLSQYTTIAVPSASLGTTQGIVHGVYFGLGNGLGHFLGGVLVSQFGAVVTFYSCAVATSIWLVIFFLCQKWSKPPRDPFAYEDMNNVEVTNAVAGSEDRH